MILRPKARNQFYSWYWNSNMTALFAPKRWFSPFVMRYLDFPGWIMTLSKRQDGYLDQRVILFRLQYETHSLQIYHKTPYRSVIIPTPNLLKQLYALRLVGVPCRFLHSPLSFFQPISPSLSSHIYSVAVPHLLCHRIYPCCPASPPPFLSATVFTADLVFHPHYPAFPPCLHCHTYASLLRFSSHYLLSSRVICCRCLSTFSDRIFSLLCIVLYYTVCSDLLRTLSSLSTLIFAQHFYFLFWHVSSLSLWCSRSAPICRVFLHLPSLRSAPIWSFPSDLSAVICFLRVWSAQLLLLRSWSDMLSSICWDQLAQICSVFRSSGPSNLS